MEIVSRHRLLFLYNRRFVMSTDNVVQSSVDCGVYHVIMIQKNVN